jgi:hypothetical protein
MPNKIISMPFNKINSYLPLIIDRWKHSDPILHFGGGDQYINILADWRITKSGKIIHSSDNAASDFDSALLLGCELVKIEKQGNWIVDPVFHFSNGYILEVFSLDMGEENWIIHFKGLAFLESFDESVPINESE